MTSELSVLLVGYGLAGRVFHAPLLTAAPGLSLDGIVTSSAERSIQAHHAYPGARVFGSIDEALTERFDLVVIATANVTHLEYAMQALNAGASVVIDKPVAATALEAQSLADAARDSGLLAIPFQNRRWDSDFLTAQRIVESGVLGMVHRFESRFDRMRVMPKPGWRGSADPADLGGMLYDLGSHLVDQALVLMGPVVSVCATIRSVRPTDPTDDDVVLLITHDSGAVSVLSASQIAAFPDPRITVLGTHGGLRIHRPDSQEDVLRTGAIPGEGWGIEPDDHAAVLRTFDDDSAPTETRILLERGSWPEFYRRVEQALRREGPPPVLIDDAVATLRVLDAARTSGTSQTTVTLDPPAGHRSTT